MRGLPNVSQAIFKKAREITESAGENAPQNRPSRPIFDNNSGGAYNSMMKKQNSSLKETPNPNKKMFESAKVPKTKDVLNIENYFEELYEGLSLLSETKDYSSVLRSLLSCYLAGKLDTKIVEGLKREDKNELFGILRDFEMSLKSIIK